jgi:hypothetical protein
MKREECRGCGIKPSSYGLHYGLCIECRVIEPCKRPLHPRYKPPNKRVNRGTIQQGPTIQSRGLAIRIQGREYLVCGCDYMQFPIEACSHSPYECPNPKKIIVTRGHDNGK